MSRTPVWLVSGFLGSGKTTLINGLLAGDWEGDRVVIVVNDLGTVSVDAQRMADAASGLLELPGGCVCCSIQGELSSGLEKLLESEAAPFDRIVLEASGVSNPAGIALVLEREPLDEWVRLDRQIAVVHAVRHTTFRGAMVQVDNQVRGADVIVMNHYDEAQEEVRRATRNAVRDVNPEAPIIATTYGRVEPAELVAASGPRRRTEETAPDSSTGWKSCRILFSESVDQAALEAALGALPRRVLRLKGFVRESAGGILHVERVGEELYMENWEGKLDPVAVGTLVAIGDLGVEELALAFRALPGARVEEDRVPHSH